MKQRRLFIFVLMIILGLLVSNSMAGWCFWKNWAGDRDWTNTGNWDVYPTSSDDAVVCLDASVGPVISTGDTGNANWLHVSETTTAGSLLTIDGGTMSVADHAIIGETWGAGHKGSVLLDSGTFNTNLLMVGGGTDGSSGEGLVTINNGTVNISWMLAIAGGYNGTTGGGVGHIQIDGGSINATGGGGLVMSDNGSMDITEGALVLAGEITDITSYGDVTAYDGAGSFEYDYDGSNTTITAIPEPATVALIGLGSLFFIRKKK